MSLQTMHIALGANLRSMIGSPFQTLQAALEELGNRGAAIRKSSPYYNTPAFPKGNGPDYVNAAAEILVPWDPQEAMAVFHDIEQQLGRERQVRWGQRTLDLDLIAVGQTVAPDRQAFLSWYNLPLEKQMQTTPSQLILPHPRMHERAFVLIPLADVAPDWCHPILGQTVIEMRDALDPKLLEEVVLLQ